jgi:hypothetical protein
LSSSGGNGVALCGSNYVLIILFYGKHPINNALMLLYSATLIPAKLGALRFKSLVFIYNILAKIQSHVLHGPLQGSTKNKYNLINSADFQYNIDPTPNTRLCISSRAKK